MNGGLMTSIQKTKAVDGGRYVLAWDTQCVNQFPYTGGAKWMIRAKLTVLANPERFPYWMELPPSPEKPS